VALSTSQQPFHIPNYQKLQLEIKMHRHQGNAIPAGHVQNPVSDSYEILCR